MDSTMRLIAICIASVFTLLIGTASAGADQSLYPPSKDARTLDDGPAGYAGTSSQQGQCQATLLCPEIANEYQATGGVRNSGHIRTSLSGLTGVEAVSSGTWTSRPFVYNGLGGDEPDELTMRLARQADVATLVAVEGNSATYSIDLVDASGGAAIGVIERDSLAGITDYVEKSVKVDPSSLKLGNRYRIRITTRYETGSQVFPGASADYDDIHLRAKDNPAGGGSGNGGNGGAGGNGGNGNGNGGGGGALSGGGKVSLGNSVVLSGSKLLVKVRCARKPRARCKARIDARLSKRGPKVTNARIARVPAGRTRRIALDVKPRFLDEVSAGKKIVIKSRSKLVGKKKAKTTFKKVKVLVKSS